MKAIGTALKIAGIGIGCVAIVIVGTYAYVGGGYTMFERWADREEYAKRVAHVAEMGYKRLWEEVNSK